ncbi:hypothetical protein [Natronorubrum halophilum]|uniref:hypothetical protein n=1 Tax=Natronorubrum halophilum TaxID=1702106 RepID=UPI0013CF3ACE|nr:hypothetical protein [Natronorubrum halophilum]
MTSDWFSEPQAINQTGITARIVDRSPSLATVRFRSPEPVSAFRPVAYKRRYPDGAVFAVNEGPRISATNSLDRRVVFAFDTSIVEFIADRWMYEIRYRPYERSRSADRYLCESDPLQRSLVGFGSNAERCCPDDVPEDRSIHERIDREGCYELAFRWAGTDGSSHEFTHTISKSAYRRARDRRGGYVRTFIESRHNPYARHLADRITSSAVQTSGPDAERTTALHPERDLLERTVQFVQSFDYAMDEESKGVYQYFRTVEESLVDGVGDCKDGTYLLAGILSHPPFAYETALVFMPDHLLLGVRRTDLPTGYRHAETIRDSPYVAIETTTQRPIGFYRDDPIVTIIGPTYRYVDSETVSHTIEKQVRLFSDYYSP